MAKHAAPPAHIDPRWQSRNDDDVRWIDVPMDGFQPIRVLVANGHIALGACGALTPAEAETLVQVLTEAQLIAERQAG